MLRVVLDPVVMLRGLLNPHSLCSRLLFDYADRYCAVFSDNTLRLLRLLLLHPLIVCRLPLLVKISPSKLARLLQYAERVRVPTEPDVNLYIALARAAVRVSGSQHSSSEYPCLPCPARSRSVFAHVGASP